MPDYTPTSVADMRTVFPERPEAIKQEPTLLELLRILKTIFICMLKLVCTWYWCVNGYHNVIQF